jgi:propionyl-CoA carboxylase alpha chain
LLGFCSNIYWFNFCFYQLSSPAFDSQVLSAAWPLETPLAHAIFKDTGKKLTVQYLDVLPLGFKIQHLGSKV